MHIKPVKIDTKDRRILYELEENCRRSLNEIAKRVGISKQALHYRIERLMREGVILRFITVMDYSKLGLINHEVWFQLTEITPEKKEQFLHYLEQHPQVRWLVTCGGKFDYAMGIMAGNVVAFSNILKGILLKYPFVQNHFITISKGIWVYPRTHILGSREKGKERKGRRLFGDIPAKAKLDETEIKILQLLSNHARIATVELAKKAGVTPATVRTKMRRLENEGIIQGYKAIIQHAGIGLQNYEVLLTTQNLTDQKEKELETYCRLNPYVTFLLQIVGKWDLNIAFDTENSGHFQQIMTELRTRFGSIIRDYEYVPILQVHKFDYAPQPFP